MQYFASQLKQNNFHSILTHELIITPVFNCFHFHRFVWQEVVKNIWKISRNRAVTSAREKSCKKKIQPWDEKRRKRFISKKRNRVNNKKRKNWDFYEIKVENKRLNFHYRLKKYCNMFTAERFSETRPLMHLSKHVFRSQ